MRRERWFQLGWILCVCAGVIPLFVGLANYVSFILSMADSSDPWRTPFGRTGFSLQDVRTFRSDLAAAWVLLNQVGWANLVMTGVTMIVASWAGIRHRFRWGWLLVMFATVWVGANDVSAALIVGIETGRAAAVPFAPMTLATSGLALSAGGVFSKSKKG